MERKLIYNTILPSGLLMDPLHPSSGQFERKNPFNTLGMNAPPSPFEMPPSQKSPFFDQHIMSSPPISHSAHEAAMAELAAIRAENALLIEKNKRLIAELELANLKLSQLIQSKA
jgi:hypothetical protein